jgi:tRNA threonylcarbamoyladenosine biosynthesis protein TsaB
MLILTIKTDNPSTEIALYDNQKEISKESYLAGRSLAETLNQKIDQLIKLQKKNLSDINGIVCYLGPGSFTGLRIGISVANALAYGLNIPIVGATEDDWQTEGIKNLVNGENQKMVMPVYGSEPHITIPKK